jgi:ornithine carbamoyltransferase
MKRDLITIADLSTDEIGLLVNVSKRLKGALARGEEQPWLRGRTMAMIFEKPSLRTRVTFETGMNQLGGSAIYLGPADIMLGQRETVPDIGKNLSLWVDVIMARTFAHQSVMDLAGNAKVPVINGLSDLYHPCQVLADVFTLTELRGDLSRLEKLHVAFLGDGNNMVHSWMLAAARLGFDFTLVCPEGYEPDKGVLSDACALGSSTITVTHDLMAGTKDADVLYTDVWASMGQEDEAEDRRRIFAPFQLNADVLANAAKDAIVMHCLPAHRGEEITAEVLEGPQSVVLQQAENRLHLQKALVAWLLGAKEAQS